MNLPLISVIVPIYKVEAYLCKCVDSLLSQTYTNLEVFLVDDGSPDNCGKICDEYATRDDRIKVIRKKNGGLSDARNVAIDVATGEWIIFVDSDDFVSNDYVETLYGLVDKYKCKVGVAWLRTFYEGSDVDISQPTYFEKVFDKMDGIKKMFYQELFDNAAWCKIYHRSLFETGIRYPFGLIYEDLPTTYLLFLQADKIAYCNRIIYNYLLRANSIEGQPFKQNKLESALKILEMIQEHAGELEPIKKAVRCRLLSFCYHILLEMPVNYQDTRKKILIDYVKANRWKVLVDNKARKKARIAAICSYLGMDIMRKLLNRKNKRKQIALS